MFSPKHPCSDKILETLGFGGGGRGGGVRVFWEFFENQPKSVWVGVLEKNDQNLRGWVF
jgi:hypothetical protein